MKGCKTTAKWQKYQNVIQNIFKKAKKGSKMNSSRHETTKGQKTITKAYNKTAKITAKRTKNCHRDMQNKHRDSKQHQVIYKRLQREAK